MSIASSSKKHILTFAVATAAFVAGISVTQTAQAAATSGTWSQTVTGTYLWSTPGDWTSSTVAGATTGAADTGTATFSASNAGLITITLDSLRNLQNLTFSSTGAGGYTINSNTFNLTGGGVIQTTAADAGVVNINSALVLEGSFTLTSNSSNTADTLNFGGNINDAATSTLTLNGANSGTNTISGNISNGTNTLGITKSGAGTWILSGINSSTGAISVNAGTLIVSNANTNTGAVTVNGGNFMGTSMSGTPFGKGAVTIGNATLTLAPTGSGSNIALSGGTLAAATKFTFSADSTLVLDKGSQTSLTYTFGTSGATLARTNSGTLTLVESAPGTLGSTEKFIIQGTAPAVNSSNANLVNLPIIVQTSATDSTGDFVAYGANGFVNSSTAASYTNVSGAAPATVGGAIWDITDNSTLGTATAALGAVRVANTKTLDLGSGTLTVGDNAANLAQFALNGGTIANGTVALGASEGTVYVSSAGGTISADISGSGNFTPFGPGTLTLSGNNTNLTGTVTLTGTLAPTTDTALGTGALALGGGTLSTSSAGGALTFGNALQFGAGVSATTTFTGSNAVTFNGGYSAPNTGQNLANNTSLLTIAGTATNANSVTFSGTGNTTITANITSGGGGITDALTGGGVLTLSGNNAFTGGVTVNTGAIVAPTTTSAFGTGRLILNGGTMSTSFAGGPLTFANGLQFGTGVSATSTISGANAVTFNGGYIAPNNGDQVVTNNTPLLTIAGTATNNGSYFFTFNGTGNITLTATIGGGSGHGMTDGVSGGAVLTLYGNNTFIGGVNVNAGAILAIGSSSNSGPFTSGPLGTGTFNLNPGTSTTPSIVRAVDSNQIVNNAVNLAGGGSGVIYYVIDGSFNLTFNGLVTTINGNGTNLSFNAPLTTLAGGFANFNAGATFAGTGDVTVSGAITGTKTFTYSGSGLLTLSGANTTNNTMTFNSGTINLGSTELGTSGPLGVKTGAGAVVLGGATLQYSAANNNDYSSRFSTAASQKYNVDTNGQAVTFGTALVSSGGVLNVSDTAGGGALTLTGTNTYNGATTITGGTLILSGTGAINSTTGTTLSGATAKFLNNSSVAYTKPINIIQGTIGGSGDISAAGGVSIGTGAIVSPGNSPASQNYTTGFAMASGGKYKWEINDANGTAGANYDKLVISNGLNIASTNTNAFDIDVVSLTAGNVPGSLANFNNMNNYAWLIATSDAMSNFDSSKFTVTSGNFVNDLGTGAFAVHSGADSVPGLTLDGKAGDLYLTFTPATAVPEPASLAILGLGAVGMLRRRRKN